MKLRIQTEVMHTSNLEIFFNSRQSMEESSGFGLDRCLILIYNFSMKYCGNLLHPTLKTYKDAYAVFVHMFNKRIYIPLFSSKQF